MQPRGISLGRSREETLVEAGRGVGIFILSSSHISRNSQCGDL